ncbi:hypothetical protein DYB30_011041 [Aphanomyces astaci]|uniref:CS domain-containing protein n=1 Tax=Aphanomyces astaci TaxID=112090 RepID=A0A397CNM8_APHAT|nr:hypothetical protein DYB34_008510 [Aphanomyces astaci]RHY49996.1 hypothetical protein DYB30_011041 [Aphanomyces astaci]RHZ08298.1 hypothetical protein DYB26_011982 [Aphanomyces astaci]
MMARRSSAILDDAAAAYHPTDDDAAAILSRAVDPSGQFGWTQTLEELYVYVPVRPRIVRKGVNVLATQSTDHHWFTVIVDTIPRVHAQLAAPVQCALLDWEIAAQKESSPFYTRAVLATSTGPSMEVCITLVKQAPARWGSLFS